MLSTDFSQLRQNARQWIAKKLWALGFCCLALGSLGAINTGSAEEEPSDREQQLTAAYLFHFTQFTEWPTAGSIFHYCIYEDAGFTELLQKAYTGKTIGESQIDVKNINAQHSLDDCQLMYFSKTSPPDFLEKIRKLPILSVGMQKDFSKTGMINSFLKKIKKYVFLLTIKRRQMPD